MLEVARSQSAAENMPLIESDFEDANALSANALLLCERYKTPPTPRAYEVWYSFAARKNDDLCNEILKILKEGAGISPYQIDQLYGDYLALGDQKRDEFIVTGYQLDREMYNAGEMVKRHITSSAPYAEFLKKSSNEISESQDPEFVRTSVERLVLANGRMRAETLKLNHSLETVRGQVRQLRAKLEKSERNEMKDPLTEISNRRYLDRAFPKLLKEAHSKGTPLCVVMADIDRFKVLNDKFGHQVGDDVLRYFAKLLEKNTKGRDVVARYGGEEFTILLPATKIDDACTLVGQVLKTLRGANLLVKNTKDPIGKITASFGVIQSTAGDTPAIMIDRADKALYKAKSDGRDRFVCPDLDGG